MCYLNRCSVTGSEKKKKKNQPKTDWPFSVPTGVSRQFVDCHIFYRKDTQGISYLMDAFQQLCAD